MKEWYKDWFDSDFYLKVYSHRDKSDAEKLLKLILNNISLPPNANILDAACGNGRHSNNFSQLGYNVVGFDLSKSLLKVAQKNKLINNSKINYLCSDIRLIPLKTSFDLILNLFTSFGYFESDEDNFSLVKFASTHLSENGYFILDYLNPNYVINNLVKSSQKNINNMKIIENRKIINNRVEKEIVISDSKNKHRFLESVRLYSLNEILSVFTKYGFNIVETFGDYSENIYNKDESERMIIIFKR
ncbi:MAG: class I SAM-dependent methyltransferase [Bacteroidetes bacterium]|nr:class I SAM-dependent methyltransferase [Bacteroidota bacterium]MBU1114491.1 class I SAM-dependent methyltransferase [Bacteroidota bacterium]MBU1799909.1 class I SAM-dependent methyltransferase [Bacteroidota bacterium]